jgi:hypothetical protein
MRWPLDDLKTPWVIHHDPPLGWTTKSEGAHLWHPMPYRVHLDVHAWWGDLERLMKRRVKSAGADYDDIRGNVVEYDIREF